MAFSLVACAVQRPNTDLCTVNAPAGHRKCYNMADDYTDKGRLKPGATPVYRSNKTIADLNKFLVVDSPTGTIDGQENLKVYLNELREEGEKRCD